MPHEHFLRAVRGRLGPSVFLALVSAQATALSAGSSLQGLSQPAPSPIDAAVEFVRTHPWVLTAFVLPFVRSIYQAVEKSWNTPRPQRVAPNEPTVLKQQVPKQTGVPKPTDVPKQLSVSKEHDFLRNLAKEPSAPAVRGNFAPLDRPAVAEPAPRRIEPRPPDVAPRPDPQPTDAARPPRVFVCYRRDDSSDAAGRLYDRLVSEFGPEHVFKDVDSIPPGIDYREHIADTLNQCDVALVVIGPGWLKRRAGHRRIDDAEDFVRFEIENALSRHIPVVPVRVRGAKEPKRELLPESIQDLAYRQMVEVRGDPHFNHDVARLIATLKGSRARSDAPRA